MKTSVFIQNLKCNGCAHTISTKLETIANISNVEVEIDENKVVFSHLNEADVVNVKTKLKNLGYPLLEDSNSLVSKAIE